MRGRCGCDSLLPVRRIDAFVCFLVSYLLKFKQHVVNCKMRQVGPMMTLNFSAPCMNCALKHKRTPNVFRFQTNGVK